MIKIKSINEMVRISPRLKKGTIHYCHYPNGHICNFVKSKGGQTLVFEMRANGYPSRNAEKFANSTSNKWN